MIPEKAIEKIVEAIKNNAREDITDHLNAYIGANDKITEVYAERKLIEALVAHFRNNQRSSRKGEKMSNEMYVTKPENTNKVILEWGLQEFPEEAKSVWGARWIFPNDILWDRAGFSKTPDFDGSISITEQIKPYDDARLALQNWLNGMGKSGKKLKSDSPLTKARDNAYKMSKKYQISKDDNRTHILYEDKTGIIQGNPQNSYGYLYVCAYLK
jgi:hypothetical protein